MKAIAPHEPNDELHSVADAYVDAHNSEMCWRAFDTEHGLKRVFIELPEPVYHALDELARQQHQSVAVFIERVIQDLTTAAQSNGDAAS